MKCPECAGKFPWEPTKGCPKFCPLCGFDTSIDDDATAIVLPAFLSAKSRANDKLYRDMEKGSEFRAHAAADMAGVPVSEMSSLKITDLNDRNDTQIAAKDTEARAAAARLGMKSLDAPFQPNGAEFGAGVASGEVTVTVNGHRHTQHGIVPRAGMQAQSMIQKAFGR